VNRFFCKSCGAEVLPESENCPACGKIFKAVRCPRCGFTGDGDLFEMGCPQCNYGVTRVVEKKRKEQKSFLNDRWVRILFIPAFILLVLFSILFFKQF